MNVHSINKAIATAMHEHLPVDKTLMDGSYFDADSDAVRFITWAISRLTPEQAARLPEMAERCCADRIQGALLFFFPEILNHATRLTVAHEKKIGTGNRRG